MKGSSMRASVISKEGIFSNVARLRTHAGGESWFQKPSKVCNSNDAIASYSFLSDLVLTINVSCVVLVSDSEFAENLAVAPMELIRPKAAVSKGSLPVRFINPGAIPDLRVIHETAVVHPDALLGEVIPPDPIT